MAKKIKNSVQPEKKILEKEKTKRRKGKTTNINRKIRKFEERKKKLKDF